MKKLAVINIVALSTKLLQRSMPKLNKWCANQKIYPIKPPLPAVTCTSQSSYLTGQWPSQHGIVGNGWYFRDECEIKFWKQSNKLVQSDKIWEKLRCLNKKFRVNNLFWWYNMYSNVDVSVTPRPIYTADGMKFPDCYTEPSHLRNDLQEALGTFPLFNFWGPLADRRSSTWIANAAKYVEKKYPATLNLVYIPHLDYYLQRLPHHDPAIDAELAWLDDLCMDLIHFYEKRECQVILLSEYTIQPVTRSLVINQLFRKQGWLQVRTELGKEQLDAGASQAFAVVDHQIAHIYINDQSIYQNVYALLKTQSMIKEILDKQGQALYRLDHERTGDLVVISQPDAWFNYYFWLDEDKAPDYARTVDIHRKPGYDPVELFFDPSIKALHTKMLWKLLKKKLGFRQLLDVIPLVPSLVTGSHGAIPLDVADYPILIADSVIEKSTIDAVDVAEIIYNEIIQHKIKEISLAFTD